jgi:DNA-binding response OmpR family regulator
MARILVIDDEPGIVRFVRRALEADGHTVRTASDGSQGLRVAAEVHPDLVVLDLLMPGVGGMGVLAALIAETPHSRVLVLSAVGDVQARVRCLDLGAVDFLAKPFAVSELVARVRSRLRDLPPTLEASQWLEFGPFRLDLRTRRLLSGGRSIELSQREFALLQHLMRHAGTVCTRAELLCDVWGYAFDPGSNVVDVTIARLRAKIEGMRIETVRNVGYALKPA